MKRDVVNLQKLMAKRGEEQTRTLLSGFSCPPNPDIEDFLKRNAIEFAKQGLSQTHIVVDSSADKQEFVGYFTLANKPLTANTATLSATMQKRVEKFAVYDRRIQEHVLSAPLIAQLGKNYTNGANRLISGDELLALACDKVERILFDLGGKFVYLECADTPKLLDFYASNRFRVFSRRYLDAPEGEYLVQMLKYIR